MKVTVELKELSAELRRQLAECCSIPETLSELTKDEDVGVRQNVAANTNALSEDLSKLARDPYVSVKKMVAANSNTWSTDLSMLARDDSNPIIRKKVTTNISTSIEDLRYLANDNIEYIRKSALEKLEKRS